jgi:hypothetical protein
MGRQQSEYYVLSEFFPLAMVNITIMNVFGIWEVSKYLLFSDLYSNQPYFSML